MKDESFPQPKNKKKKQKTLEDSKRFPVSEGRSHDGKIKRQGFQFVLHFVQQRLREISFIKQRFFDDVLPASL